MNISNLTEIEKCKLCRYLYKYGMSPINDVEYDLLEAQIKDSVIDYSDATDFFGSGPDISPFEQSYDDDIGRPDEILAKALSPEEMQQLKVMENAGEPYQQPLDAYVSKSMKSYRTLAECKTWIDDFVGVPMCVSPKIDGINTTTEYVDGMFKGSRTRGRKENSIDISRKMRVNMGDNIDNKERFIVAAEAVVSKSNLEKYNTIFPVDKALVTCRGAAISILKRDDIPEDCSKYLDTFVFRTNVGDTLSEGLDIAESLGFNVVPHEVYTFNYKTFEEFEKEISALIWKYRIEMDKYGIPTDGLVLQINDNSYFTQTVTNTAYDRGNLAVKALAWEAGVYTSKVVDIIMSSMGTVQYNCKAQVEPVYTEEGKCMQFVNLYNVNNMIVNDVHIGDLIEFEYVNETTINFKRKVLI